MKIFLILALVTLAFAAEPKAKRDYGTGFDNSFGSSSSFGSSLGQYPSSSLNNYGLDSAALASNGFPSSFGSASFTPSLGSAGLTPSLGSAGLTPSIGSSSILPGLSSSAFPSSAYSQPLSFSPSLPAVSSYPASYPYAPEIHTPSLSAPLIQQNLPSYNTYPNYPAIPDISREEIARHTIHNVVQKIQVPVSVPQPYPVTKTIRVPQPYPVRVDKPVPVQVRINVPVPVERPYPVQVPHPVPYHVKVQVPYPVEKPYPVEVTRTVPVPVEKPVYVKVPQVVRVSVPQPYPVPVERKVSVNVPHPVIVKVPEIVNVHHAIQTLKQPVEYVQQRISAPLVTPSVPGSLYSSGISPSYGAVGAEYPAYPSLSGFDAASAIPATFGSGDVINSGLPSYGHSTYGLPSYGHSTYGHSTYGHSTYGLPSYGLPSYGLPSAGQDIISGQAGLSAFESGHHLASAGLTGLAGSSSVLSSDPYSFTHGHNIVARKTNEKTEEKKKQ